MTFTFVFHPANKAVSKFIHEIDAKDFNDAKDHARQLCSIWKGRYSDLLQEGGEKADSDKIALEKIPTHIIVDELILRLKNSNAIEFIDGKKKIELRCLLIF